MGMESRLKTWLICVWTFLYWNLKQRYPRVFMTYAESVTRICRNCTMVLAYHAKSKCLYETTWFEPAICCCGCRIDITYTDFYETAIIDNVRFYGRLQCHWRRYNHVPEYVRPIGRGLIDDLLRKPR